MKKVFLIGFCAIFLLSSCARHIIVNFQESSDSTGTIVLAPTANIQNTVVTMDDKLLVDKKYVKKVTIKNVPIGEHKVNFSADSWAYKEKIDQKEQIQISKKDAEVAKIITRPAFSNGYYILLAAIILANATTYFVIW